MREFLSMTDTYKIGEFACVQVMFVVLVEAAGNQSGPLFQYLQTWATGLTYLQLFT